MTANRLADLRGPFSSRLERKNASMGLTEFLIIAGLVFVNGFFVAAEFALVKVRTSQIEQLAEKGNWAAKLVSRISGPSGRLPVGLPGRHHGGESGAGLGDRKTGSSTTSRSGSARFTMEGHQISLGFFSLSVVSAVPIAAFAFVTFLHVALGEQAPKSLAIRSAKIVALWTVPPLMAIYFIFWPVIWLLNNSSNLTLKLLGLGGTDEAEVSHTEEELRHIVAESVAGGHLSRNERIMIENVLNLEEKTARRIMVPRPDIVYLNLSRPVEDNLRVRAPGGPYALSDLRRRPQHRHRDDPRQGPVSRGGREQRPPRPAEVDPQGPLSSRVAQAGRPPRRVSAATRSISRCCWTSTAAWWAW